MHCRLKTPGELGELEIRVYKRVYQRIAARCDHGHDLPN
jgi:hypothetical protein